MDFVAHRAPFGFHRPDGVTEARLPTIRKKSGVSVAKCSLLVHGRFTGGSSVRTHSDRVSFIWSIADLIRDHFKRGK